MSAQNSNGIQTLLEAERGAHEIVQKARAFRTQRLKAAKADAASEIEAYKKAKEAEYQQKESQHTGTTSKATEEAESKIQADIEKIKSDASKAKAAIIKQIIDSVTSPTPTPHINA